MKIFFPDIHKNLTKNMAKVFKNLGHKTYIASNKYRPTNRPPKPVNDFVWNETWNRKMANKFFDNNVELVDFSELLDLKPDVIFITAYENQFEILKEIAPRLPDSKIVHYSGNDYWEGAYPISSIKNYLCADYTGYTIAYRNGINHLYYKPFVDFDLFSFSKSPIDTRIIGTYITNYHITFPQDYLLYCQLTSITNQSIEYQNHSNSSQNIVLDSMKRSLATLHIKRLEGYGMSVIESMACGRPVLIPRQYIMNKSLQFWTEDEQTALLFSDADEYVGKLKKLVDNDYKNELQLKCANRIREIINNDRETENLKNFLENLV